MKPLPRGCLPGAESFQGVSGSRAHAETARGCPSTAPAASRRCPRAQPAPRGPLPAAAAPAAGRSRASASRRPRTYPRPEGGGGSAPGPGARPRAVGAAGSGSALPPSCPPSARRRQGPLSSAPPFCRWLRRGGLPGYGHLPAAPAPRPLPARGAASPRLTGPGAAGAAGRAAASGPGKPSPAEGLPRLKGRGVAQG